MSVANRARRAGTPVLPQLSWLVAGRARGGRSRMVGTAAGVALGVALLLLILAAYAGLTDRTERDTWVDLPGTPAIGDAFHDESGAERTPEPLTRGEALVKTTGSNPWDAEYFQGREITRVDIAALPGTTVRVPGVGVPPAVGEYYASPAMARLIAEHPNDQLGARYGAPAGVIGDAALASPDTLLVVVGATESALLHQQFAHRVTSFPTFAFPSPTYQVLAIIGGIAVLFPVVVLISIVTRLGQAARSERFSTLRLIGATPGLVARIAAFEIGAAGILGAILGVGLFWVMRPLAAQVEIEDGRFFIDDLHVGLAEQVLIPLLTAVLAAAVAYVTTLRADLGPLGASREQRERAPRALSLIPLAVGVLWLLGAVSLAFSSIEVPHLEYGFLLGFVLVLIGLLAAGPYLTASISRLLAGWASGPAGMLAAGRIVRHPRAIFRTVSGLVLAVFVVSVFAMGATAADGNDAGSAGTDERVSADALVVRPDLAAGAIDGRTVRASLAAIQRVAGVEAVVPVSVDDTDGMILRAADADRLGIPVDRTSGYVRVDADYLSSTRPTGPLHVTALAQAPDAEAPPQFVIVTTDGTPEAHERARTAIITGELPILSAPMSRNEESDQGLRSWASKYAGLASLGMVLAMLISAVSLTVATVAGILDRRRVLGLLRLTGMPIATLRRMVSLETAVPLLTVLVLCIGSGFFVAWALVVGLSVGGRRVSLPGAEYLLTLGIGLLLVIGAVIASFRAVKRFTSASATRFE